LKLVCLQNILIDNARRGAGEVIDVSEETAASLIKQGLAASVENDAEEITDKLTAEDSSVTEEKETPDYKQIKRKRGRPRKR
jgi:hypothetical protein